MKQKNYKNDIMTFAGRTDVNAVDQPQTRHCGLDPQSHLYWAHRCVKVIPHPLRSKGSQRGTSCATLLPKQSVGEGKEFLNERSEFRNSGAGSCLSQRRIKPLTRICSSLRSHNCALSLKEGGKLAAFTLAEVLISLGIIGIVAAMTIPTLISKYEEKTTVIKLKKMYSMLSQGYMYAVQEYGQVSEWGIEKRDAGSTDDEETVYYATNAILVRDKLFQNIKTLKICDNAKDQSECNVSEIYYTLNGGKDILGSSSAKTCSALLSDGSTAIIIANDGESRGPGVLSHVYGMVYYDLNGGSKTPNTYGKDLHVFYLTNSGIIPWGTQDETEWSFSKCSTQGRGCTAWVIYNENLDYLKCDDLSWNSKRNCGD